MKKLRDRTRSTVALDFDGVIHGYDKGYQDGSIYGEPIPGAFDAIAGLLRNGYAVYIHSTRKPRQIRDWLERQLPFDERVSAMTAIPVRVIPWWYRFWNVEGVLGVSRRKLPAIAYVDDRAVHFNGDWTDALGRVKRLRHR